MLIIIKNNSKGKRESPQSSPEGILLPPQGPEHCCSILPLYRNGDSLEEVLLAVYLPCYVAQALPNVPDEAECCLTKHTIRFHSKRDKVMTDLVVYIATCTIIYIYIPISVT